MILDDADVGLQTTDQGLRTTAILFSKPSAAAYFWHLPVNSGTGNANILQ